MKREGGLEDWGLRIMVSGSAVGPSSSAPPPRHHPYHLTAVAPYELPAVAPRPLHHFPHIGPSDVRRATPYDRPAVHPRPLHHSPHTGPSDVRRATPYDRPAVHPRQLEFPFGPCKPPRRFPSDPTVIPGGPPYDPAAACRENDYWRKQTGAHTGVPLPGGNRRHMNDPDSNDMRCERITDESDMCNESNIWNDPDISNIQNDPNLWNEKINSKAIVWGGVFNDFCFLGAETFGAITKNNGEYMLAHDSEYWKLNEDFYVLTAGLCSITRACLWILATHVLQTPRVPLTLESLANAISTNKDFKEMRRMVCNDEILISKDDFLATILIVHKGVRVGKVRINHRATRFSTHDSEGAGHGYIHAESLLEVLPKDSTPEQVFKAAFAGFSNAAQRDHSSGGQGRFFCLFHDGRYMWQDVHQLPKYWGIVRNFTPMLLPPSGPLP